MVVGDPFERDDIDMGPVVSAKQRERVLGFVDRAAAEGANIATGGRSSHSRGFFVDPTVVTGIGQRSEIVQREVFGPVVTVQPCADDTKAIEWANDVEYGLAASVWTGSMKRGMDAVRRLQFGTVWLNDHGTMCEEMPHGGFKLSGYGKEMSRYGLEDYTVVKHVLARFD
jgi:betaine-aldehyde dehydrogenase/aminobutyraldehyde dehydrogenase